MTFEVGDEVRVKSDRENRLGIIAGNPGKVVKVSHKGNVVHVYVYPWGNTFVYGASELEENPKEGGEDGQKKP